MKRLLLLLLIIAPFTLMAQVVEPDPWYQSGEFWVIIAGAVLLVIEWILKAVPTSKPVGFILKGIVAVLNWFVNRAVKDKKKGGGSHK